jgi:hypothetical protein
MWPQYQISFQGRQTGLKHAPLRRYVETRPLRVNSYEKPREAAFKSLSLQYSDLMILSVWPIK